MKAYIYDRLIAGYREIGKDAEIVREFEQNGKPYAEVRVECGRCGGKGILTWTSLDNGVCWKCLGAKYLHMEAKLLSESDYQKVLAKQEAKRTKEEETREERRHESLAKCKVRMGFGHGDDIYLVAFKNSYSIKDELKEKGAKWYGQYSKWGFTTDELASEYPLLQVNFNELYEDDGSFDYQVADYDALKNIREYDYHANLLKEQMVNEYVGSVGDRIETEVEIIGLRNYTTQIAYQTKYMTIVLMQDAEGHRLVWNTGANNFDEGQKVRIKGIIKSHDEYENVKQTYIKNVKEVVAK